MNSFAMLSALARAVFALWALLLCLTNIGSGVLAAVRKRYRMTALALAIFAPGYGLWQVVFDLSLFRGREAAAEVSLTLGEAPWIIWFAGFALLTVLALLLLGYNIRYDRTYITPGTIKLYLDKLPCGVCCWRDNGRVLFSNVCMNRLCRALTDGPLLNGNHLQSAAAAGIHTLEGRVWRFTCRDFFMNGERLHEMIASDITAEYAKTQALERDKAELSELNRELREYYRSIDEITRRQEILQAKVNIHDEMNRLMLSTIAAGGDDAAELDRIFPLWEKNALLLCLEADEAKDEKAAGRLEKLAAALRIQLIWKDALPESMTGRQRSLFFSAAQEAIANAVKHASAKTMEISFTQTEQTLSCRFINDGTAPTEEVRFTGGLANLSRLAARQDASVTTENGERFTLMISFPKNGLDSE